jgi:pimeloyl-ACP methyl ester carboxylesterase
MIERRLAVSGTMLYVQERGAGWPLLLMHGAGEDAATLAGQAEHLAGAGYRVLTHDRRGTGRSGREAWPGERADQHADDAAGLLEALDTIPATVLGLSSGAVVALALGVRRPDLVDRVVAWEPPALGVLPEGTELAADIMAPVDAYLAGNPGDWYGAQLVMFTALGARLDPAMVATRPYAEPMVRDDPYLALRRFTRPELARVHLTLAVGTAALGLVRAAVDRLAAWTGRPPVVVDAEHEVYRTDPAVLTGVLGRHGDDTAADIRALTR